MSFDENNLGFECPRIEIAAYIDGDLGEKASVELESHFAECAVCREDLSLQKMLVLEIEAGLHAAPPIDLPADFTRKIVVTAESSVAGVRPRQELFNAAFIVAGLLICLLFSLGANSGQVAEGVLGLFDRAFAVGSFFGHILYSALLGIVIVLRSIGGQSDFGIVAWLIVLLLGCCVGVSFLSRRGMNARRA